MTPRDPLAKFASHPYNLGFFQPRHLNSKVGGVGEGIISPGCTTLALLNWNLRLPPSYFGVLMPTNLQAKKGATGLAGAVDSD